MLDWIDWLSTLFAGLVTGGGEPGPDDEGPELGGVIIEDG